MDDTTHQGKLILDLIEAIHPEEEAVIFLDDERELAPVDKAFDEFKEEGGKPVPKL